MAEQARAQADSPVELPLGFQVIGVGASAGGLKPIEQFLTALPSDTGACCVIVQHLSPDFKSLMKELLERRTAMPVIKIEAEMEPRPNTVYLIPPGQNLVLRQGKFQLAIQDRGESAPPAPHHPINIFFQSLAEECGERSIGVVLSGTGTDGTRGLQAINEAGGLTFVQDPSTAEFTGMPNSAIQTCIIDQALSPEKLAKSITRLLDSPKLIAEMRAEASSSREADSYLQSIVATLAEREQVDFSHYKENTLSRRIHRRCVATGFTSLEDYIEHLNHSEEERQTLKSELLINVTYFFRNPEAWSFLEQQVLPGLIDIMDAKNPLRIWCAACSTGEEAYSMAMMLQDLAEQAGRPLNIKIFATDLDQAVLDRASKGIFPDTIRDEIPERLLKKYFTAEGDIFVIKPSLRKMVIFANHNLVQDAGFTRLHLVSCRNVLIYMQSNLQEKVIRSLNFSLRPDGILFMGESENLGSLNDAFTTLDKRWKIYRKFRTTSLLNYPKMRLDSGVTSKLPLPESHPSKLDPVLEEVLRSLVARNGSTCLVVDPKGKLIHVAGSRSDVLLMPEGRISLNLQDRVVPALRLPILTAISRTKRASEQEAVSYRGIQLRQEDGETLRTVKLAAWRPKGQRPADDYSIVLIEEEAPETRAESTVLSSVFEADNEASQRYLEMEYELQQTRENLQATIEELEATNEEQQSTNEELVAANEELQSTNEELHSVNEELYTVNSEYQAKIQELLQLNADVDNLLASTEIGVIFLDKSLAVRRFTPAARNVFKLISSDIGRPIDHLKHQMDLDNLTLLLQEVLNSGQPHNLEIKLHPSEVNNGANGIGAAETEGEQYLLMRLHPYRTITQETDGIVLSFVDISRLKATEQQLRQAQAKLEANYEVLEQRVLQRTRVLESFSNNLRQLHRISTTHYDSEAELFRAYLEAGRVIFGLQAASMICRSGEQLILQAAVSTGAQPELGQTFSHSQDFSWLTWIWAQDQQSIGLADMESFELDEHPLYAGEDIQAYLATRLNLEGEMVGILEFVSYKVRMWPFAQQEIEILEMIAAGIANGMMRTRDQDRLVERETRYRKLYHQTPTMLHSIDAEGKLVSVSDYWLQKLGYKRSEVIEHQFTTFLSSQSKAYAERVVLPELFEAGFCTDVPFQFICKNGESLDVLLSSTLERDDHGQVVSCLAVLVDVTETRRLQQQLEQAQALADAKETADIANRAKSRFLASISHELRTPLNSILGFSELLGRDRSLHAEHKKEIATIQRAGRHLLSLIDSVLDLSKIEAEQIVLSKTSFDLFRLLEQEIWSLFHAQAASKGLQFEIVRAETAPAYISTDAVRLRQILINLVNNAIKFTEEGSVILHVSSSPVASQPTGSSTRMMSFSITDTGTGIPAQVVPKLFEAFTQSEEAASLGGTGLGLNISYRLAKLLGGALTVESQADVGSTFTLKMPVQLSASDQVVDQDMIQDVQSLAPGQAVPVILIVEDNLDNQRFLRALLTSAGFICHAVYDGNEVMQAWENHDPDLIFMDINLPNVNGKTLIKAIKTLPKGRQTPIIAFTASSFKQQQEEILATGCDGYLKKPATANEIFHTIQRYLPVDYLFIEESSEATGGEADLKHRPQLSVEQLQKLSEVWLLEFQHAIVTGSALQMGQLIQQLPEPFADIAAVLKIYVSEYRYQELLTLLTPLCQSIKIAPLSPVENAQDG